MRLRLLIVFLLIVIIPMIALSWFAYKNAQDQREINRHRFISFITKDLARWGDNISELVKGYERKLNNLDSIKNYSTQSFREHVRSLPAVHQLLVLDQRGKRIYPSRSSFTQPERDFILRSKPFIESFLKNRKQKYRSRKRSSYRLNKKIRNQKKSKNLARKYWADRKHQRQKEDYISTSKTGSRPAPKSPSKPQSTYSRIERHLYARTRKNIKNETDPSQQRSYSSSSARRSQAAPIITFSSNDYQTRKTQAYGMGIKTEQTPSGISKIVAVSKPKPKVPTEDKSHKQQLASTPQNSPPTKVIKTKGKKIEKPLTSQNLAKIEKYKRWEHQRTKLRKQKRAERSTQELTKTSSYNKSRQALEKSTQQRVLDTTMAREKQKITSLYTTGKLTTPIQSDMIHPESRKRPPPIKKESVFQDLRGWSIGFRKNGINLIYSFRKTDGYLITAEISRTRLIADIIRLLPTSKSNQKGAPLALITLTSARGDIIYQWGNHDPVPKSKPMVSYSLAVPLNTWKLNYYSHSLSVDNAIHYAPFAFGLTAIFLAVMGLAFYFYRESNRELTVASQRVTFVNQVSHELKTPLTNIRMYAELLEDDLEEAEPKTKHRMQVIVNESQRLSRMIINVLNFASHQRKQLTVIRSLRFVDDSIRQVLEQAAPGLEGHEIEIDFQANADEEINFDTDILEQILHNLISNVEKYAHTGHYIGIQSCIKGHFIEIKLSDKGPGIPRHMIHKVFEAFYRGSDQLSEGVSGTGIGLSISRELARLHGGDLIISNSRDGITFTLTLNSKEN